MRYLPFVLMFSACTTGADFQTAVDRSTITVGDDAVITITGSVSAKKDARMRLSAVIEAPDFSEVPEVTFETLEATPSGAADILDGEDSADNESGVVLFALDSAKEDVSVRWRMTCETAGTWNISGRAFFETASGAPLTVETESTSVSITCE